MMQFPKYEKIKNPLRDGIFELLVFESNFGSLFFINFVRLQNISHNDYHSTFKSVSL